MEGGGALGGCVFGMRGMGSWFEPFRECLKAKVGETGVPLANASREAVKADEFEADTAVAMGWLFWINVSPHQYWHPSRATLLTRAFEGPSQC